VQNLNNIQKTALVIFLPLGALFATTYIDDNLRYIFDFYENGTRLFITLVAASVATFFIFKSKE